MGDGTKLATFIDGIGGKANPYLLGASIIIGGISFFKAKKAEKARRKRLKAQYASDVANIKGEIPEIVQEYKSTADYYREMGNLSGQRIYEAGIAKMDTGGQSNLAFGGADAARQRMGGLLGAQVGAGALQTRQYVDQTQNQLGSELNRAQGSINDLRAAYAKEGIYTPEIDLQTNNMKYV